MCVFAHRGVVERRARKKNELTDRNFTRLSRPLGRRLGREEVRPTFGWEFDNYFTLSILHTAYNHMQWTVCSFGVVNNAITYHKCSFGVCFFRFDKIPTFLST